MELYSIHNFKIKFFLAPRDAFSSFCFVMPVAAWWVRMKAAAPRACAGGNVQIDMDRNRQRLTEEADRGQLAKEMVW